jgi:hypothetical protein
LAAPREQADGGAAAIVTRPSMCTFSDDNANARMNSVFDDVRSRLQAKKK